MKVVAFNRCTDPKTFAEIQAPGYWSTSDGRWVSVTLISDEEMAQRIADRDDWYEPEGLLKRPTA